MSKRLAYILIFLSISSGYLAQNFPVQAFLQVSPPHTSYLPEYANPTTNQMKVLLTLTDFTVPSHQVKLRFKFEGNGYTIENPVYLNSPAFTLTPGTPFEVSGADLAYYLNSANLLFSGIDPNDYEHRKVLPEGPCTICVEVLDYTSPTPTILANPACASVWFSLYDPPFLNTPMCGMEVPDTDPQQILFSWTPLNMASPTGFASTEYVFELFEIRPENSDPNIVVNSTLPIFVQVTQQPFVNYGITEPQLQLGMEYVWRVQVRDNTGKDHFKNLGYSQVCTFTYGNIASSVLEGISLQLESNGTGVRQGLAWWNGNAVFDEYVLEYRKTGNSAFQWFSETTTGNQQKMNNLEPETEYECRVKGLAAGEASEWSNTSTFVTQPPRNYECNDGTAPLQQPNVVPLVNAIEGMVFTVGQFEMMVTSITPLGVPGHYTGTGKITIPFALINLNVSFDDILVDDNLAVRQGKVEAISQGIDAWEHQIEIDACLENPHYFAGVDSITFPENGGAIVHFQGTTYTIDTLPAALYTDDGYVYYIFEDGTYEVEFTGTISLDEIGASDSLQVRFQAKVGQEYGFDAFANGLWTSSYETIPLEDGTNYIVPFKSMLSGGTDQVMAVVDSKLPFTPDSLQFKCLDGRVLAHEKINSTTYRITLDQFTAEEEAVYAYWQDTKLGKLNVRAYDQLNEEVVIVPVNNAPLQNPDSLQDIVNNIYKQALVNWTVTIDSSFNHTAWDMDGNGKLANADDNAMSHYSSEMRALRDAYLDLHPDFDKNKRLLFVVEEFDQSSTKGYMVRGKGLGFLSKNPLGRTVAHELGHSFGLYHTFPHATQGSTANLLDYVLPAQLTKHQWEKIHQPSIHLSFLDDEEDAAQITVRDINSVREVFGNFDGSLTFLSIGNKPITLKGDITELEFSFADDKWTKDRDYFPIGTLMSFTIDGKKYKPKGSVNSLFFKHYRTDSGEIYIDSLSHQYYNVASGNSYNNVLAGLPCVKDGDIEFIVFPFSASTAFDDPLPQNKGEGDQKEIFHYSFNFDRLNEGVPVAGIFRTELDEEMLMLSEWFIGDICGVDAVYAFRAGYLLNKHSEYSTCLEDIANNSYSKIKITTWKDEVQETQMFPGIHTMDEATTPLHPVDFQTLYMNGELSIIAFESLLQNTINTLTTKRVLLGLQHDQSIAGIIAFFDIQDRQQKDCLLSILDFETRKNLLNDLNVWQNPLWPGNWDSDKERLLVDLIRTTPPEQIPELLQYLGDNNFAKYWSLYNDTSGDQNAEFVLEVSRIVLTYPNEVEAYIGTAGQVSGVYYCDADPRIESTLYNCSGGTFTEGDYFQFSKHEWNTGKSNGKIYFFASDLKGPHTLSTERYCYYDGNNIHKHLTPFHTVSMEFQENMQFSLPDGNQIVERTRTVMPALWVYWIYDSQRHAGTMAAIEVSANILAIGITIATWGTVPPILSGAEILFNVVDISISIKRDDILSYGTPEQKELLSTYNEFAAVIGVAQFGLGVTKSALKLNLIRTSIKESKQAGTFANLSAKFKSFYNALKQLPQAGVEGKTMFAAYMERLKLEFEINKFSKNIEYNVLQEAEVTVQQSGHYIFVNCNEVNLYGTQYTSTMDNVGQVVQYTTSAGTEAFYLDNLKLYNALDHGPYDYVVKKLDNVPYNSSVGGSIEVGTVHFVRVGNLVYVKLGNGLDWITNALMTKLNNLGDDLLKQKFIDDFADASIDVKNALNGDIDLVESWKVLDDLGESAFDQLKKNPDFLRELDEVVHDVDLNRHIFDGDLQFDGNLLRGVSGVHSSKNLVSSSQTTGLSKGNVRIQPGTKTNPNSKGYYEAKVQVYGDKGAPGGVYIDDWVRGKKSTFFPDNWSFEKIHAEIANGIKNKTLDPDFPTSNGNTAFKTVVTDGTKLQLIYDGGKLISAFPNLR